jgi:thiazole synthase ThiGH ThiG subunit
MNPITVFLTVACLAVGAGLGATGHLDLGVPLVIVGVIIASALKMANTWEKFVILRAGRLGVTRGKITRRQRARAFPNHSGHRPCCCYH